MKMFPAKKTHIKIRGDPTILEYHSVSLRASDLQLLNGPNSLNDVLLDFYYEHLERDKWKNNRDLIFFGVEVTQCMSLMDEDDLTTMVEGVGALGKPFVFYILGDENGAASNGAGSNAAKKPHWSLLIFSRPEKKFFHFDSNGTRHSAIASQFVKHIKNVMKCPNAIIKSMRCLQQNNDYDCGMHVICMTDKIADYINRFDCVEGVGAVQREVISIKRSDMKKLVKLCAGKPQKEK